MWPKEVQVPLQVQNKSESALTTAAAAPQEAAVTANRKCCIFVAALGLRLGLAAVNAASHLNQTQCVALSMLHSFPAPLVGFDPEVQQLKRSRRRRTWQNKTKESTWQASWACYHLAAGYHVCRFRHPGISPGPVSTLLWRGETFTLCTCFVGENTPEIFITGGSGVHFLPPVSCCKFLSSFAFCPKCVLWRLWRTFHIFILFFTHLVCEGL